MSTFVPVVFTGDMEQLRRSRQALDIAGIPTITGENGAPLADPGVNLGPLLVSALDEERACEILASLDAGQDADPLSEDQDDEFADDDDDDDFFLDDDYDDDEEEDDDDEDFDDFDIEDDE